MTIENRPEWGRNPNHVCDELCAIWEQEQRERKAWQQDIQQSIADAVEQED